jgi:hypothetical protein
MNLAPATLAALATGTLAGTWYRCFPVAFGHVQLALAYSKTVITRFNPGRRLPASSQFEILYLAETGYVAECEARVLIGSPLTGAVVRSPFTPPFATAAFPVRLQQIVDLCDVPVVQPSLQTGAQELTGDWQGNHLRLASHALPGLSVAQPTGSAPTQELGHGLYGTSGVEGFLAISSIVPTRRILGVFPAKLQAGSQIGYALAATRYRLDHRGLHLI